MTKDALKWLARGVLAFEFVAVLLPLLRVGYWPVRLCDFPRIQLIGLLLVPLLIVGWRLFKYGVGKEVLLLLAVIVLLAAWQLSLVMPYTPVWPVEVPQADSKQPVVGVLVVNLEYDNDQYAETLEVIRETGADLLLLMELNDAWAAALADLHEEYPHRVGVAKEEGLGIALWSRSPLIDAKVRRLVTERRPSIFAKLELGDAGLVNFFGVHPTPPGLDDSTPGDRRDSRVRDAELILVAKEVADAKDEQWLVAGDFNDVAWSYTTRLFQRLSGLRDPRVGRGLYNSYHADYWCWRFPIDQIFLSEGAAVQDLRRVVIPGSDHFALYSATHFPPEENAKGVDPEPTGDDKQEAEEIVDEGEEDAEKRGIEPK